MSKAEDLAGLLDANGDVLATNLDNVSVAFADLTGKPTTISGYGITDAFDGTYSSLTGAPTAVSSFTNDSGYATTTYVDGEIANLVASAPATLDTLNELAAALGDDANFSTTVTNSIATKAPLANPTFTTGIDVTGTVTADGILTQDGTSGATASTNADQLVIESSTRGGLSILTPNNTLGEIYFGDPENNNIGRIWYDHSNDSMAFRTNASEAMRIASNGNVGINEASPLGKLHVKTGESGAGVNASASDLVLEDATDAGMSIISTGTANIYFGDVANGSVGRISYSHSNNALSFNTNAAERMRLESDGDLHADGDVIAYSTTISDERLKTNIQGIENAVAKVGQLNGYTFEYKADGKISAGVIAQEVEQVLPEAVSEKQLPLKTDDDQEYKVVNYDALHGLLIEAIKELSARVEALEAK